MKELDTYPMLEEWLHNYIFNNHSVYDYDIKSKTNAQFVFGCRYEFDIIAGFQTKKRKQIRLYNIEVKIDGNIKGLLRQGRRNNASWFDYVFIATPLNSYLEYYVREVFKWMEMKDTIHFGWLIFDWETKRVWELRFPKINKNLLGRRERNEILARLDLNKTNLLGGY